MTPLSLCLLVALAAEPARGNVSPVYNFSPRLAAAIRGQSPGPSVPPLTPSLMAPTPVPSTTLPPSSPVPTLSTPIPVPPGDVYNPFQPPALPGEQYQQYPGMSEPFMNTSDPVLSSPELMAPMYSGVNGPQPYRFGWIPRLDLGYIPESDVEDYEADVEMFELNSELRYNTQLSRGWVMSVAPQFDYRAWNFSGDLGDLGRVNLYRFGLDMTMATPEVNGWSMQFTFNPSINTDFENSLTADGWNLDGNIMGFYRFDPVWMGVIGAGYLDRVDDIVIPYAGFVITPNDRWEFRLLFPKGRISYFLGSFWAGHHWLYVSSEYHVEAYQVDTTPIGGSARNRVQYEDWRLALGLRSDHGTFDKYIEAAWITDRNFEFEQDFSKTNVGDSVLIRAGIKF